jgi:glycosyltransferase involved in cell wall biosynthesis
MMNKEYLSNELMVSVCTITYNHEEYLRDTIEGVLKQEVNFPIEFIIADDCSSDRTEEIVNEYIKGHPNGGIIKYLRHTSNKGMMNNFLWALNQCKGKYIAFCEGDDYWTDSSKLEKQLNCLENNKDINICAHAVKVLNCESNEFVGNSGVHGNEVGIKQLDAVIRFGGGYCPMASIMIRSTILEDLPDNFVQYPGAHFFIQMMGAKNGVVYLPDLMAVYRKNSSTSVIKNVKNNIDQHHKWIEGYLEMLDFFKSEVYPEKKDAFTKLEYKTIWNSIKSSKLNKKSKRSFYKRIRHNMAFKDKALFIMIYQHYFPFYLYRVSKLLINVKKT